MDLELPTIWFFWKSGKWWNMIVSLVSQQKWRAISLSCNDIQSGQSNCPWQQKIMINHIHSQFQKWRNRGVETWARLYVGLSEEREPQNSLVNHRPYRNSSKLPFGVYQVYQLDAEVEQHQAGQRLVECCCKTIWRYHGEVIMIRSYTPQKKDGFTLNMTNLGVPLPCLGLLFSHCWVYCVSRQVLGRRGANPMHSTRVMFGVEIGAEIRCNCKTVIWFELGATKIPLRTMGCEARFWSFSMFTPSILFFACYTQLLTLYVKVHHQHLLFFHGFCSTMDQTYPPPRGRVLTGA